MIFEGNQSVIDAIKEKKKLIATGQPHDHIRPLLVVDGGLMKGAYGTGAVLAIDELGFTNIFSSIVGISSGAIAAAYLLSGNKVGGSIMYEEACSREFRPRFNLKNVINVEYLERVLEGETGKGLIFDKVFSHMVKLYIGMSEYTTGQPAIIQPTSAGDLLRSIRASISIPGSVSLPSYVHGVRYVDGAASQPHILAHICEQIDATHILIITNQDKATKHISWAEHFMNVTLFRYRMSPALRKATNWRREARHAFVEKTLTSPQKPTLFVWGDNSIGSRESDPTIVKNVVEKSRQWWHEILA